MATAIAMADCTLDKIDKTLMARILHEHHDVTELVITLLPARNNRLSGRKGSVIRSSLLDASDTRLTSSVLAETAYVLICNLGSILQKGVSMSDRKNFIVSVAFLILLALAPIMVAEEEIGRFVVDQILFAAGTEIKAGEYNVKWESHGPDVTVEFTPIGKAQGVKVPGKIVQVNEKFDSNNMVIAKDPDGRDVIKELQFSGKKIKIIFGCDNPSCFHSQGNSEFPAYQVSAAGKDPWEMDPAEKIYG